MGSPPLVRVKLYTRLAAEGRGGITPARAGKMYTLLLNQKQS